MQTTLCSVYSGHVLRTPYSVFFGVGCTADSQSFGLTSPCPRCAVRRHRALLVEYEYMIIIMLIICLLGVGALELAVTQSGTCFK